jgi:DNA-binding LacI/PurR family transcriptional regulator
MTVFEEDEIMETIEKIKSNSDFLGPLQVSSQPRYLQIRKYILDHILEGTWQPGEQLLPDMTMARKLGINHITLGKALNILRDEGYLVRNRGRGTFVADKLPSLHQQTDYKIALVLDDANESTFMTKLFLAIHDKFEKYNFRMEFISSRGDSQLQLKQLLKLVKDKHINGCILWSLLDSRQLKEFLAVRPALFPIVLLDHQISGFRMDFSGYDDYASGEMLGHHLAAAGMQRCILFQPPKYIEYSTNRQRRHGLQDGLGFNPINFTDYQNPGQQDNLTAYVRQICQESNLPTALVAVADSDAVIIAELLKEYAPDNSNISLYTFCTSIGDNSAGVVMPVAEMGINAVEIIHARLAGDISTVIERRAIGSLTPNQSVQTDNHLLFAAAR